MKNIRFLYLKKIIFLVVKFSVYLNRHVFVMGKNVSGQLSREGDIHMYSQKITLYNCINLITEF